MSGLAGRLTKTCGHLKWIWKSSEEQAKTSTRSSTKRRKSIIEISSRSLRNSWSRLHRIFLLRCAIFSIKSYSFLRRIPPVRHSKKTSSRIFLNSTRTTQHCYLNNSKPSLMRSENSTSKNSPRTSLVSSNEQTQNQGVYKSRIS